MLQSEDFQRFAKENPQLEIAAAVRGAKHPQLRAEYVHGATTSLCVRNQAPNQVLAALNYLRNRFGFKSRTWEEAKRHATRRPSIQGVWTPSFTPPPLSATAQANASAVVFFKHQTGFDHTQQVFPSTNEAAAVAAAEAKRAEELQRQAQAAKPPIQRRGRKGVGGPRRVRSTATAAAAATTKK